MQSNKALSAAAGGVISFGKVLRVEESLAEHTRVEGVRMLGWRVCSWEENFGWRSFRIQDAGWRRTTKREAVGGAALEQDAGWRRITTTPSEQDCGWSSSTTRRRVEAHYSYYYYH